MPNYQNRKLELFLQGLQQGSRGAEAGLAAAEQEKNLRLKALLDRESNRQAMQDQQASDLEGLKTLQDEAPEGAQIHSGKLSYGVDPTAKLMGQQMAQQSNALKQLTVPYQRGSSKLQESLAAAQEGLKLANDPKNIGSLGQARTLMLKSMGMNRYNEKEADAVLPSSLKGKLAGMFNAAGGDAAPLNDSQRRVVNSFFRGMLEQTKSKHDNLVNSSLEAYRLQPGYDAGRAHIGETLGGSIDRALKESESYPSNVEEPSAPAPSFTDRLKDLFVPKAGPSPAAVMDATPTQGPPTLPTPSVGPLSGANPVTGAQPATGAPGLPSFEEFKRMKKAGQLGGTSGQ